MLTNKSLLLFGLIFLSPLILKSQSNTAGWTSLGWKSSWDFPVGVDVSGHYRSKEGFNTWDAYFGELEFDYKFYKDWSSQIELRSTSTQDNQGNIQGIENWSRYRINLKYTYTPIPSSIGFRLGYQKRFGLRNNANPQEVFRLLVEYEYPIKNWKADPKFFTEYFWDQLLKQTDKWRWGVESSKKISIGKLSFRYFVERSVFTIQRTTMVVDMGLQIRL